MIVKGNYYLRLKIGSMDILAGAGNLYTLQIFQSIDRLVPYMHIELQDTGGILTQLSVGDENDSIITIGVKEANASMADEYSFKIIKRDSIGNPSDSVFSIYAILNSVRLYKPSYCRGFVGYTLDSILNKIKSETAADDIVIDSTIKRRINIVQPNKPNAWFLNYLSNVLYGDSGEGAYFINYILDSGKVKLRCVSLNYFLTQPVKKKFVLNHDYYEDASPVFDYEFVEDATAISLFGTGKQKYRYFDFDNGEYRSGDLTINNVGLLSLTPYFLVEENDILSSYDYVFGRNTDIINARYKAEGRYRKKLMSLSQLWVTTMGDTSLLPGDIIEIDCLQGLLREDPQIWRMSGKWMIRRIIHVVDNEFYTRLLLTRAGIETDVNAGLVEGTRAI